MTEKNELRNQYRRLRDAMPAEQATELSAQICTTILQSEWFMQAESIYVYYPLGKEADLRKVTEAAWKSGKRVAFPRVNGKTMDFFAVTDFSQLFPGTFGVMEPEEGVPVDWKHPLILVPGVAFDRNGNRMGYGKGYYDRYFSAHGESMKLGIAYELQMAEQIPAEPTDQRVDAIVTEAGIVPLCEK